MKLAVIGAGRWGKNHVRTLSEMGQLGAVIEGNPETREAMKAQYKDVSVFASLKDEGAMDFDAYTVAVPAEHHFSIAKSLLNAGKHVLVEKPITLNSKDAKTLIAIANENKLILQVGHLLLFHPAFKKMKALILEGKIGKVEYLYSNRLNLGTVRTEENSLWSFAPHDISLFQDFLGEYPKQVTTRGGAFLQTHIHDTTMTVLNYPGNTVGHIFVSWLHPFKEHRFVVIGSKGMLSFEDTSSEKELLFYEKGIDWVNGAPIKRDGATERVSYPVGQPLKEELEHFINCIQGKDQNTRINGAKGLEVLQILEAAQGDLEAGIVPQNTKDKASEKPYYAHETAVVDDPCEIGENTKIWHFSHVQPHVSIGRNTILGQNVNVGSNVKIGNHVKIQNNVSVYEGVELEDYVFCGPSMVFTNILNPRSKYPQADSKYYHHTLVREGASIGANATIVCGITIGRFAFIGAGAVVTKDVPDFAMIVGNPGRIVGWMSEGGVKLQFDEEEKAFCEKSQKWYRLTQDRVVELKGE